MDAKKLILSYIAQNPNLKTEQIKIGFSRASLGLHLRNLADKGLIVRTQENKWNISNNYIMEKVTKNLSPMDIAEKYIRAMISCR